MFLRPFGLYCSACFDSLFVSIFCTCCSYFFWYCFISFTAFCAPVFCLIHWFFSLSSFVIPSKCLKYFICAWTVIITAKYNHMRLLVLQSYIPICLAVSIASLTIKLCLLNVSKQLQFPHSLFIAEKQARIGHSKYLIRSKWALHYSARLKYIETPIFKTLWTFVTLGIVTVLSTRIFCFWDVIEPRLVDNH